MSIIVWLYYKNNLVMDNTELHLHCSWYVIISLTNIRVIGD